MTDENYEVELVEELAIAHVQAMAIRLMDEKKISHAQLAELMDVSPAHISQLFASEPQNLSIRKAARLFHALGEDLNMTCAGIERLDKAANEQNAFRAAYLSNSLDFDKWHDACANSNETTGTCDLVAA